jgi:hypothetical protein
MKRHNISFSDPQDDWLTKESQVRGISLAELVRRIIDEHRDNLRKADKE